LERHIGHAAPVDRDDERRRVVWLEQTEGTSQEHAAHDGGHSDYQQQSDEPAAGI
jgi:hypothetical protein